MEAQMSRKYEVQGSDTLSAIAERFYGDATLFNLIAAVNQLADPNVIAVGRVLSIPDLPSHWDVVQVTGWEQARKVGTLAIKISCKVPAGMRLVIESVSGHCVLQQGMLYPLALGEIDALGITEQPLAIFPWVQSFYGADIQNVDSEQWFAFHTATRLYVPGPIDHLTFAAGFIGLDQNQQGFAEAHVCVNGYLEAAPNQ
jgi:LysM repeat protein